MTEKKKLEKKVESSVLVPICISRCSLGGNIRKANLLHSLNLVKAHFKLGTVYCSYEFNYLTIRSSPIGRLFKARSTLLFSRIDHFNPFFCSINVLRNRPHSLTALSISRKLVIRGSFTCTRSQNHSTN